MTRFPIPVLFAALAAGCLLIPDLPVGWEDAEPVASLVQAECGGDPYDGAEGSLEASLAGDELSVAYGEAHFRCEQEVEAFYVLEGDVLSILVQPIDMDPVSVANCDCLYDVDLTVDGLDSADLTVELYRRWDNINDPNDPVLIASLEAGAE
jgi:hypothetical protein